MTPTLHPTPLLSFDCQDMEKYILQNNAHSVNIGLRL